jgi:hypothetical protein
VPALEVRDLKQRAVLWSASGTADSGELTFAAPVEIACRWVDGERTAPGPDGGTQTLSATAIVATEVYAGDCMRLGTLDEYEALTGTGYDTGVMEVLSAGVTVDIKNRNTRRELGLSKYRDAVTLT